MIKLTEFYETEGDMRLAIVNDHVDVTEENATELARMCGFEVITGTMSRALFGTEYTVAFNNAYACSNSLAKAVTTLCKRVAK